MTPAGDPETLLAVVRRVQEDTGLTPDAARLVLHVLFLGAWGTEHVVRGDTLSLLLGNVGEKPIRAAYTRAATCRWLKHTKAGRAGHRLTFYLPEECPENDSPEGGIPEGAADAPERFAPLEEAFSGAATDGGGEITPVEEGFREPEEITPSREAFPEKNHSLQGGIPENDALQGVIPENDALQGVISPPSYARAAVVGKQFGDDEESACAISPDADAEVRAAAELLASATPSLRRYLRDRVPPDRQAGYVATVVNWLNNLGFNWAQNDGVPVPAPERSGKLKAAIDALAAAPEAPMKAGIGDPRNLSTKLSIIVRAHEPRVPKAGTEHSSVTGRGGSEVPGKGRTRGAAAFDDSKAREAEVTRTFTRWLAEHEAETEKLKTEIDAEIAADTTLRGAPAAQVNAERAARLRKRVLANAAAERAKTIQSIGATG
jgi:hypothetical protein